MKVIVAGSRKLNNYNLVKKKLDNLFRINKPLEIVSGHYSGADMLGERYARENSIGVILFPANWTELGKKAGPIRNKQMAEYATHLVAFYDGVSPGTTNMIEEAKLNNLITRIINI